MPPLLLAFVAVSVAATAFNLLLRARQAAHVARHRSAVPAPFAAHYTLADHQRAADYDRARQRLGAAQAVVGLAIALAWALFGFDALYAALEPHLARGLARSVVLILGTAIIGAILDLPFALIRTFGLEQRFGFNRTTPRAFILDRLKGAALSLVIATPLLAGLLWLMRQPSRLGLPWWVWAWIGLMAVMLVMMHAVPRWIAPLFNTFTPLEGPLRTRIEGLLARCGFQSAGLFVMDASRRSAHGNAYFTGLGRTKRIVLFDTLVAQNSEPELEAVLAHELGHYRLNHIRTGLVQSAVVTFAALFAIGWLSHQPWLLPSFGITHQDDALALVVGVLAVQMASPLLSVAGNWLSRVHEYQADDFARRMVGADPMVSALLRLSRDNASTLTTTSSTPSSTSATRPSPCASRGCSRPERSSAPSPAWGGPGWGDADRRALDHA